MKHDFEERRKRRIDSAENRAEKNAQQSDRLWEKADDMASIIPMGQPILVGHHSEKGDRRYRSKIDDTRRKSIEASEKSEYYSAKAESIKSNDAIFSDDPSALEKLEAKLKSLSDLADFMKKTNACIRKKDKKGFLLLPMASEQMWEELHSEKRFGGFGFAGFTLSNNSAERRRLKQRIEQLKKQGERKPIDTTIGDVRLLENREANRLQILFGQKPEQSTIAKLKAHGFRWCRSEGAWQRHISAGALYWAREVLENLNQQGDDTD